MPTVWYVVRSASPVMIPGSAIGRMTTSEIVSRPKKLKRETASDASVPSASARSRRAEGRLDREPERSKRTPSSW